MLAVQCFLERWLRSSLGFATMLFLFSSAIPSRADVERTSIDPGDVEGVDRRISVQDPNLLGKAPAGIPGDTPQEEGVLLRLSRAHFDPVVRYPLQAAGTQARQAAPAGVTEYYVVQFDGPIQPSWLDSLEALGARVFDYLPDYAFLIRLDSDDEQAVRSLSNVRWLGLYEPAFRISQAAVDAIYAAPPSPSASDNERLADDGTTLPATESDALLRVIFFAGEDPYPVRSRIESLGGEILDTVVTEWKGTLKVRIPREHIADLTPIRGIQWIEPWPAWELSNNVSTGLLGIDSVRRHVLEPIPGMELYGEGQTVAVCDTGLDRGSAGPERLLADFLDGSGNTRVKDLIDRVGDGPEDTDGHGTHVAGSVLGNGALSGSDPFSSLFPDYSFAGSAPKARLVFQAAADNKTGEPVGIPSDLNILFAQAAEHGADLHTNSWGEALAGSYNSYSQDVDEYVWNHPAFLILFAAGNHGYDLDADGVIDPFSLNAPASAKNCMAVGASEGYRPPGSVPVPGRDNPWGTGSWLFRFSADPIKSDHVSNNPDGMAAFSSRGPSLDGRHKPDIVAPGTNILSCRTQQVSNPLHNWGPYYNQYYYWMGGTSMATPLAAGAAALVREYLMEEMGFEAPTAALVKAVMLNGAEDISPGQYGTGPFQEVPAPPVPNHVAGWGRVNVGNTVSPASPMHVRYWDDKDDGLNTGEEATYRVKVLRGGSSLKINLVWSDYPGSPVAGGALVNDLDLSVSGPGAGTYYPDHASQKGSLSCLAYGNSPRKRNLPRENAAVRFSPSTYPVHLDSARIYYQNPSPSSTRDVTISIYDDDGANGVPGTVLFSKTVNHVLGWISVGITGVVVNEGDFYVGVETADWQETCKCGIRLGFCNPGDPNDPNDPNQPCLNPVDPTGRTYSFSDGAWTRANGTASIEADIRTQPYSTSFDRVNNTLGVTIDDARKGTYRIHVSGHNVPKPSLSTDGQPYALVVRGDIRPEHEWGPGSITDLPTGADTLRLSTGLNLFMLILIPTAWILLASVRGRSRSARPEYASHWAFRTQCGTSEAVERQSNNHSGKEEPL